MENRITFPSNLFRSKIRQELLGLFFTNPQSRYYVRQLQTMFKTSVGSLHRELTQLKAIGVLKSEREGNLRFYSANNDYPLFSELKGIVAKTLGIEGNLRGALKGIPGIKIALIYGSFAAGKETERSDIDLFLIGQFDEDLLNKKLRDLEKYLAREINYTSMRENEFKEERKKKSPFLKTLLSEPKLFLIGDESELRRLA
jgi:predicted nucleotidyltransferase